MIATIITIFMVIAIVGFSGKGDTWAIVGCAAVIVVVWIAHMCSVDDARAWVNRSNYWSMSGKDRARARHRWEAEARAEEARERAKLAEKAERKAMRKRRKLLKKQRRMPPEVPNDGPTAAELQEAKRKREAYVEYRRRINKPTAESGPVRVCHYCGRSVHAYGRRVWNGHESLTEYRCPKCGRMNQTVIGH